MLDLHTKVDWTKIDSKVLCNSQHFFECLTTPDTLVMLTNEHLISRGLYVSNPSLNETFYKMVENLNTSVKKFSEKKAYLGNEFENQIFELKKQNRIQLAEKYENFWKLSKSNSKRLSLSLENEENIDFIEDPNHDLGRE
jgi:hypothetical protein